MRLKWWRRKWQFPDRPFPARFSAVVVDAAIAQAKVTFPERDPVVLHDGLYAGGVDCRAVPPDEIRHAVATACFVYACQFDDVGLPFVDAIVSAGGVFISVTAAEPSSAYHQDAAIRATLDEEWRTQHAAGFAKWDSGPGDFVNICQVIRDTRNVAGNYVEIGCFNGSSAAVALNYMRRTGVARSCYFLDAFDMFSYPEAKASADRVWAGTHETHGEDVIRRRLKGNYETASLCVDVRRSNVITDALPDGPIAVANIDVDMYEAVAAALRRCADRVADGGVVIVEDPGHTPYLIGAFLALREFLASPQAENFRPIYMESGQTLLFKR